MRVAVGSVARRVLEECGIYIGSHVVEIGGIKARTATKSRAARDLNERADASEVRVLNRDSEAEIIAAIDHARENRDNGWRRV